MKQLFKQQLQGNKLLLLSYAVVLISFFLPNRINSLAFLFFGLISILYGIKGIKKSFQREHLIPFLIFAMLCIGLIYTDNLSEGIAIVERNLLLVLIPFLIIPFKRFNKNQKQALLNLFILSAFIVGMYCLAFAGYAYWESGTLYPTGQTDHFIYNRFMHHRLSSAIGLHAIYFSFYCSFAGVAVLQKLFFSDKPKRKAQLWNLFLLLFFTGLLFLLKSSLFAFVFPLACLLLLFIKLKSHFSNRKYVIAFALTCLIAVVFSYEGVRSKLDNFETNFAFEDKEMRPLAMRLALWKSAWEVVQEHPLVGVGTGDSQDKLMEEFKRVNFLIGIESNFNAHNMYLQYWMSNGILAVFLFMLFLVLLLIKALKHRNFLFFAFVLFFTCFSITESTMLKQKGIVFFMFFAFLFITDPNCWNLTSKNIHENSPST